MKAVIERTPLLGVHVDQISLDDLIEYILDQVEQQNKAIISYVNVHAVNLACELDWFKDFINQSQVVFCDGFGVKWAAQFLSGIRLERFTPPDWFDQLAEKSSERGISMYFLGAQQATIKKAAEVLRNRYPRLQILGTHHGFFNKEIGSSENLAILGEINALQPDILVVGFGMPAQEKWILENWSNLHVKVAIPVGAFFDYLARDVVRAPRWMTDHGLEWLGRLVIEPRRLWKRYVLGNPLFVWRVLLQKIRPK